MLLQHNDDSRLWLVPTQLEEQIAVANTNEDKTEPNSATSKTPSTISGFSMNPPVINQKAGHIASNPDLLPLLVDTFHLTKQLMDQNTLLSTLLLQLAQPDGNIFAQDAIPSFAPIWSRDLQRMKQKKEELERRMNAITEAGMSQFWALQHCVSIFAVSNNGCNTETVSPSDQWLHEIHQVLVSRESFSLPVSSSMQLNLY